MILVGDGRVASVWRRADVQVVGRNVPIPDDPPVIACTPAASLPDVFARAPKAEDVVVVQNGAWAQLLPAPAGTRGVLWFAAPGGGAATTNRPSLFVGRHAAGMVRLCQAVDLPAEVIPADAWGAAWGEKMLWNAVFGLLGERYGETVGTTACREAEVAALADELAPALGIGDPELTPRLLAYGAAIGSFSARLREYPLRNGWIIAEARARGLRTPLHDAAMSAMGRPDAPEGLY